MTDEQALQIGYSVYRTLTGDWQTQEEAQHAVIRIIKGIQPEGETFESIRQWAHGTFGVASPIRTIERTDEEWQELLDECYDEYGEPKSSPDMDRLMNEAADVVITLCNLPGLQAAIDAKMAKNRARTWNVMGDGTGYHVKEPQA